MTELTLQDVLDELTAQIDTLRDELAEISTKIDEINLPVGNGFSEFES